MGWTCLDSIGHLAHGLDMSWFDWTFSPWVGHVVIRLNFVCTLLMLTRAVSLLEAMYHPPPHTPCRLAYNRSCVRVSSMSFLHVRGVCHAREKRAHGLDVCGGWMGVMGSVAHTVTQISRLMCIFMYIFRC